MTNYFIGVRRPGTAVRDIQDILTDMDEVTAYGDQQSNMRRLIAECNFMVAPGQVAGNYFVQADGTLTDGSGGSKALAVWHLDPANYALSSKSLGLILRASVGGNDAANLAGDSVGVQLNAMSGFGVQAGQLTDFSGAEVVGCGPSCGFGRDEQSVAFPAAGFYGIIAVLFSTVPAGHRMTVNAQILRYQDQSFV